MTEKPKVLPPDQPCACRACDPCPDACPAIGVGGTHGGNYGDPDGGECPWCEERSKPWCVVCGHDEPCPCTEPEETTHE